MNNTLFDYIQSLSLKDKKTISQKALKVCEESGELAKVTLPFDNAHGTTHRFIEKERVLEESVDVILTAISMAYDLGYSHSDIEDMMWTKAQKWQEIQVKEEKVEYPIPYEIHVTVNLSDYLTRLERLEQEYVCGRNIKDEHNVLLGRYTALEKSDLEKQVINDFKKACEEIGVKPIVLDLENGGKTVMKDAMTSSHHLGTNTSSYKTAKSIESYLIEKSFKVDRVKIETVPWHPAAPSKLGDEMPKDCYFEAHIGCIITPEEKPLLEHNTIKFGAHLSRNFFKQIDGGKFVNMLTLREYDLTYEQFEAKLEVVKAKLKEENIEFEKVITEFSIYDTKVSHDFGWIEKLEIDQFVEVRK